MRDFYPQDARGPVFGASRYGGRTADGLTIGPGYGELGGETALDSVYVGGAAARGARADGIFVGSVAVSIYRTGQVGTANAPGEDHWDVVGHWAGLGPKRVDGGGQDGVSRRGGAAGYRKPTTARPMPGGFHMRLFS